MPATNVDLWRGSPPGTPEITSVGECDGILYPDFEERELGGGRTRRPDVTMEGGMVQPNGGTSMWDFEGFMDREGRPPWVYFTIPEGTEHPESLTIHRGKKRRKAPNGQKGRHYQVEVKSPMTRDAFCGALDNFARAAYAKAYENAHGGT